MKYAAAYEIAHAMKYAAAYDGIYKTVYLLMFSKISASVLCVRDHKRSTTITLLNSPHSSHNSLSHDLAYLHLDACASPIFLQHSKQNSAISITSTIEYHICNAFAMHIFRMNQRIIAIQKHCIRRITRWVSLRYRKFHRRSIKQFDFPVTLWSRSSKQLQEKTALFRRL